MIFCSILYTFTSTTDKIFFSISKYSILAPEGVVDNVSCTLLALQVPSVESGAQQSDGQTCRGRVVRGQRSWSWGPLCVSVYLTWAAARWPPPPRRWTSWRRSSSHPPPPKLLVIAHLGHELDKGLYRPTLCRGVLKSSSVLLIGQHLDGLEQSERLWEAAVAAGCRLPEAGGRVLLLGVLGLHLLHARDVPNTPPFPLHLRRVLPPAARLGLKIFEFQAKKYFSFK